MTKLGSWPKIKADETIHWVGYFESARVNSPKVAAGIFAALVFGPVLEALFEGKFGLDVVYFAVIATTVVGTLLAMYWNSRCKIARESRFVVITDKKAYFYGSGRRFLESANLKFAEIEADADASGNAWMRFTQGDFQETFLLTGDLHNFMESVRHRQTKRRALHASFCSDYSY
jgi:hypothetical protein